MAGHSMGSPGEVRRPQPVQPSLVARLRLLALRGIGLSFQADRGEVVFTRSRKGDGRTPVGVGSSARYTAMVALGLDRVPESEQSEVLAGLTAQELATRLVDRTATIDDFGDLAAICWAAAETGAPNAEDALVRMLAALRGTPALPTVHAAWALTALVAARRWSYSEAPAARLRDRLLTARRSGASLFGHATDGGRYVGCFADQVYPIQALARYAEVYGDAGALQAADACAATICDLQGPAGQWWWHYDSRTDRVLEGYPVYSVHQHAMAPMALHDLAAAGGANHGASIELGLSWLESPPELAVQLLDDEQGVVWRKVARREFPRKSVRATKAMVGRVFPNAELALIDRLTPPVSVDWECRPYELGWLLYAWSGAGGVPDGAHSG
jgi:hypothetical protein